MNRHSPKTNIFKKFMLPLNSVVNYLNGYRHKEDPKQNKCARFYKNPYSLIDCQPRIEFVEASYGFKLLTTLTRMPICGTFFENFRDFLYDYEEVRGPTIEETLSLLTTEECPEYVCEKVMKMVRALHLNESRLNKKRDPIEKKKACKKMENYMRNMSKYLFDLSETYQREGCADPNGGIIGAVTKDDYDDECDFDKKKPGHLFINSSRFEVTVYDGASLRILKPVYKFTQIEDLAEASDFCQEFNEQLETMSELNVYNSCHREVRTTVYNERPWKSDSLTIPASNDSKIGKLEKPRLPNKSLDSCI